MKVLALVKGTHFPSSRYRVRQFERPLAEREVTLLVREFPRSRAEWNALAAEIPDCAIVWIQKKRIPGSRRALLRRHGAKLVYDVDDAVMVSSGDHPSWTRHWRFARMCEGVDAITAGNDYLASLASLWNPSAWVVPTVMDAAKYAVRPPPAPDGGAPVVLGWIGGNQAMAHLDRLRPVLAGLAKRGLPVRLKVVSGKPFEAPGIPIENVSWSEERETADVASFDIGLAPMPVTPWTLGKCGTKVLQCMAAGVPAAASRHPTHTDIVTDGWNGILAGTDDEWTARLAELIRDPAERARMGRAARATVEARFSIGAVLPRLCEIFEQTAAGFRRPAPFA